MAEWILWPQSHFGNWNPRKEKICSSWANTIIHPRPTYHWRLHTWRCLACCILNIIYTHRVPTIFSYFFLNIWNVNWVTYIQFSQTVFSDVVLSWAKLSCSVSASLQTNRRLALFLSDLYNYLLFPSKEITDSTYSPFEERNSFDIHSYINISRQPKLL